MDEDRKMTWAHRGALNAFFDGQPFTAFKFEGDSPDAGAVFYFPGHLTDEVAAEVARIYLQGHYMGRMAGRDEIRRPIQDALGIRPF